MLTRYSGDGFAGIRCFAKLYFAEAVSRICFSPRRKTAWSSVMRIFMQLGNNIEHGKRNVEY
jgi:hypothetical protein